MRWIFLILFFLPLLSSAQDLIAWPEEPGFHRVDSVWIQSLEKHRAVWVYLPPDFTEEPKRQRNLLVMQDGQNLFDPEYSFIGEWHVDEHLDSLSSQGFDVPIVVAPENGGSSRVDEYSPSKGKYGGGLAKEYASFIVEDLLPRMENHYQPQHGFQEKWLMGSSLGGSISAYIFLNNPNEFSTLFSFSPAYWYTPKLTLGIEINSDQKGMVYHIAGAREDSGKVEHEIQYMELFLRGHKDIEFAHLIHEDGEHTEAYWSKEFYNTMRWFLPRKKKNNSNVYSSREDEYFITIYEAGKKKAWGITSNKKIAKRIDGSLPKNNSLKREKVFIGY